MFYYDGNNIFKTQFVKQSTAEYYKSFLGVLGTGVHVVWVMSWKISLSHKMEAVRSTKKASRTHNNLLLTLPLFLLRDNYNPNLKISLFEMEVFWTISILVWCSLYSVLHIYLDDFLVLNIRKVSTYVWRTL